MSVVKTKDFIKELALELETTQADAKVVQEAFINVAHRILTEQQAGVPLGALGNIKVEVKAAREYPNIQDPEGDKIQKSAHYAVKYVPAKKLKDALKEVSVVEA